MAMKLPRAVGISGTNGAGKDVLAGLLEKRGYTCVSLSDILRAELTKIGLEHTRENLSAQSKKIRDDEGDGAMVKRLFDEYPDDAKLCITSIRTPGEANAIQQADGMVIWVDADPKLRYERVVAGGRGRVTDTISYDEFLRQQEAEMTPTVEGNGLNMSGVRQIANVRVENNFQTITEYEADLTTRFGL